MSWIGRIIAALLIVVAVPFHGLVPVVKITEITNPYVYSLLVGADPLVTAYVDAGWVPALLLLLSTLLLLGALVGVFKGERWAASLIFFVAVADAASLYFANSLGYTTLGLGLGQIAMLGGAIVLLWLIVRAVTKPA